MLEGRRRESDGTEVEFATADMDQKLFVSRTLVALPSVEKLRRFLEADRERFESIMSSPAARKRSPRKPNNGVQSAKNTGLSASKKATFHKEWQEWRKKEVRFRSSPVFLLSSFRFFSHC